MSSSVLLSTHLRLATRSSTSSGILASSSFDRILDPNIERTTLSLIANLHTILSLPLDPSNPLIHPLSVLNSLLELLVLDLLSVLLEITLLLGSFRFLDPRGFVDESSTDSFHVNVGLDHFSVVVVGSGERNVGLLAEFSGAVDNRESLFVAMCMATFKSEFRKDSLSTHNTPNTTYKATSRFKSSLGSTSSKLSRVVKVKCSPNDMPLVMFISSAYCFSAVYPSKKYAHQPQFSQMKSRVVD